MINTENWYNEITIDMIPGIYQTIASEIGIQNFFKLVKIAGGDSLYIPNLENVFKTYPKQENKGRIQWL